MSDIYWQADRRYLIALRGGALLSDRRRFLHMAINFRGRLKAHRDRLIEERKV